MTEQEFRVRMLTAALMAGEALCEYSLQEDIKKEPEQVRKNVATILKLLIETEEFLSSMFPQRTNV